QGNIEHALALSEEMLAIDPSNEHALANKDYFEYILQNRTLIEPQAIKDFDSPNDSDSTSTTVKSLPSQNDLINKKNYKVNNQRSGHDLEKQETFEKLCRDTNTKLDPHRASKLVCRYRHNNHPYLLWKPIKEEQLFDKPEIFLYHDIIHNADIDEIKSLATPRLQRAVVVTDAEPTKLVPADYRISKSTWLNDEDSPAVARLSRLISATTTLSMETAEPLQIGNYGIGGHYDVHVDFSSNPDDELWENDGNRIATWLTYLNDVEQGGATVFPEIGARVAPEKGSAIFWYNLYTSGAGDYRTRHAGCPVLIGNKWVANKWIHERGQEFRRRCSLDPMI
ncbi:unnamed protein product, partial [Rotaria sordida]